MFLRISIRNKMRLLLRGMRENIETRVCYCGDCESAADNNRRTFSDSEMVCHLPLMHLLI